MSTQGFPKEPGRSSRLPLTKRLAAGQGNEPCGTDGWKSEHPSSTEEAGEPLPEGAGGGKAGAGSAEPSEGKMKGAPSPESVSTRLQRIAELARSMPTQALTTLAHHMDMDWLREAHRRTRKGGAVGVDGQTAEEYAEELEDNLQRLLNRFKAGTYQAPPVRRVHIPKGDGKSTRPLGIPAFEDKVLQRAVAMVLEAVYEEDFLPCSYGFRPRRSAHQALEAVRVLRHAGTRAPARLPRRRVRDGVLRRAIDKWLKAGVLEGGSIRYPEEGAPQGGVVTPPGQHLPPRSTRRVV
jgi:RNA-directed DNA polymerase